MEAAKIAAPCGVQWTKVEAGFVAQFCVWRLDALYGEAQCQVQLSESGKYQLVNCRTGDAFKFLAVGTEEVSEFDQVFLEGDASVGQRLVFELNGMRCYAEYIPRLGVFDVAQAYWQIW